MDESQRRAEGLTVRRSILGDTHVERATTAATGVRAEFQDLITRYAWGEIWTRPGLDVRTRRILVLGTLIALGRFDEFRLHAGAALTDGALDVEDIGEIILQQAIYCGVPAANHAFAELAQVEQSLSGES